MHISNRKLEELEAEIKGLQKTNETLRDETDKLNSEMQKIKNELVDRVERLENEFKRQKEDVIRVSNENTQRVIDSFQSEFSALREKDLKIGDDEHRVESDPEKACDPAIITDSQKDSNATLLDSENNKCDPPVVNRCGRADCLDMDRAIEEEIIDLLITNLRMPIPNKQTVVTNIANGIRTETVATKKEILFPAHLI
ncbi:hypothetical protein HK098_000610, partial [Nowakowskiella sp. JEL0407]